MNCIDILNTHGWWINVNIWLYFIESSYSTKFAATWLGITTIVNAIIWFCLFTFCSRPTTTRRCRSCPARWVAPAVTVPASTTSLSGSSLSALQLAWFVYLSFIYNLFTSQMFTSSYILFGMRAWKKTLRVNFINILLVAFAQ